MTHRTLTALLLVCAPLLALADDKVPTKPKVEPSRVAAAHILIAHTEAQKVLPGTTRSKAEALARAKEALAYARKADVSFADAAAKYSDDPTGKQAGGRFGPGVLARGQIHPLFKPLEDALFGMEVGQVSEIVESPFGFHIVSRQKIREWGASHILIAYAGAERSKATRTKVEALAKARELHEKLVAGGDFAALAKEHSDGPSGPSGGNLGIISPGQLVPPFEKALDALEIGKFSGPVETPFGYHLILRTKVERVGASHILIAYTGADRSKATRSKDEAKKLAMELLEKAKAEGADFGELAKANSDGPSGPRGGDLGDFGRGRMVPAFDKVVFALKIGEVGFCETGFGFHVIKRTR